MAALAKLAVMFPLFCYHCRFIIPILFFLIITRCQPGHARRLYLNRDIALGATLLEYSWPSACSGTRPCAKGSWYSFLLWLGRWESWDVWGLYGLLLPCLLSLSQVERGDRKMTTILAGLAWAIEQIGSWLPRPSAPAGGVSVGGNVSAGRDFVGRDRIQGDKSDEQ